MLDENIVFFRVWNGHIVLSYTVCETCILPEKNAHLFVETHKNKMVIWFSVFLDWGVFLLGGLFFLGHAWYTYSTNVHAMQRWAFSHACVRLCAFFLHALPNMWKMEIKASKSHKSHGWTVRSPCKFSSLSFLRQSGKRPDNCTLIGAAHSHSFAILN